MDWVIEGISKAFQAGLPVELIATIILTIAVGYAGYKVIQHMMSSKKEILDSQKKIDQGLQRVDDSLKTTCTALELVAMRLEMMTGNTKNINLEQALIVSEVMVEQMFSSVLECYFDSVGYMSDKPDPKVDDDMNSRIISRVEESFQSIYRDLKTKLESFHINSTPMTDYLDESWMTEFSHIKVEITNRLILGKNDVKNYCHNKEQIFKSSIYEWCKQQEKTK